MAYISSSGVIGERSPWSIGGLMDMFWGLLNFIVLFFKTLISPNMSKEGDRYSRDYRPPGQGPPRPPRKRMGGLSGNMDASCGGGPMGGG